MEIKRWSLKEHFTLKLLTDGQDLNYSNTENLYEIQRTSRIKLLRSGFLLHGKEEGRYSTPQAARV